MPSNTDIDDELLAQAPEEILISAAFGCAVSERLDRFLARQESAKDLSREKIKSAIESGACLVDGVAVTDPARKLRLGEVAVCRVPNDESPLVPSQNPVDVLYEDEDIAVVFKPAGLTVHPCPSCTDETLVHRLLNRFPKLSQLGGQRPGIVHRLDHDTSGLMLVALSERARLRLTEQFARHEIRKMYLALVYGKIEQWGECKKSIGRHPTQKTKMSVLPDSSPIARSAHTEWFRLYEEPDGIFSLVAVLLHTGRTHQIRVHLSDIGFPLLGDSLYRTKSVLTRPDGSTIPDPAPRQMLHAWKLEFKHPITGKEMRFVSPMPEDFMTTAMACSLRMSKFVVTGCPACGKSALTNAFAELGVPTWSADETVRTLYEPKGEIAQMLAQRYGDRFLDAEGRVSKPAVFEAMCKSSAFRRDLESIVHPAVNESMKAFFIRCEEEGRECAVAEVPLWFESKFSQSYPRCFKLTLATIGVSCPTEIRHARLREKRGWSEETIRAIDSWQWSEKKKMKACNTVIENTGTLEDLLAKAKNITETVCERQKNLETVFREIFGEVPVIAEKI